MALAACHKTPEEPAQPVATSPVAAPQPAAAEVPDGPAVAEADVSAVLAELTQAVRKFAFEQKRTPSSIDELVTGGYIGAKPTAPSGKRFSIDPKSMQVVLAKP